MPPCGGVPYLERLEEEAEAELRSSSDMIDNPDTFACMLLVVNPDAAAADLAAVQHQA